MIKDVIEYNGKQYQVSTTTLTNYCNILETMIFPIENNVVSGNEVFVYRTFNSGDSYRCHGDICQHPEKYLNDDAIKEYLKKKEED